MNSKQKKIAEDAKRQLEKNTGILKGNERIQKFVKARQEIDKVAATKNPLIKEYINLHKEAEKDANSSIGKMAREMKNVAAQQEIYALAAQMSTDENEKNEFMRLKEELNEHPAMVAYEKYIEGLQFLSGMVDEVRPEVKVFYRNELAVPLQNSRLYEMYRVGVNEFTRRETEKLNKKEEELLKEKAAFEIEREKFDEKERSEGKLTPGIIKILDQEKALNKEIEEFEKNQSTMDPEEAELKSIDLAQKKDTLNAQKLTTFRKEGTPERKAMVEKEQIILDGIHRISSLRNDLPSELSKQEQEIQDAYQKAVAKTKAKELYSKAAQGMDILCENFVGDYPLRKDRNTKLPFKDRMTPSTFCIAAMLRKGYRLEEIMDPKALLKEKKEVGEDYIKHREANDVEWYVRGMYDGAKAMMDAFKKYVKDHKEELKTEQDLIMHMGTLGALSNFCFDMFQELSKCRDADKWYKKPEDYELMISKINGYDCGALTGTSTGIRYELSGLDADYLISEVRRHLCAKMLLEEIQKDEPDIDSIALTLDQRQSVESQLILMPEIKEVYGDNLGMDKYSLSNEGAKLIGQMQSIDFLEKNNIRYDKARQPITVKKSPETIGIEINAGSKVEFVASRNGKQMILTNIPASLHTVFKGIENKAIRAKDNSPEFNQMMEMYDKTLLKLDDKKPNAQNLSELMKVKEAAEAYILAKRKQKGYTSTKMPDRTVDNQMLGKSEEKGPSIFTVRGKDRYDFALNLVKNIVNIEKEYDSIEKQKENIELSSVESEIENFEI